MKHVIVMDYKRDEIPEFWREESEYYWSAARMLPECPRK
jgi:hypothetical protein